MIRFLKSRKRLEDKAREKEKERRKHKCNICGKGFQSRVPFKRFCQACREESELFRFAEWLTV